MKLYSKQCHIPRDVSFVSKFFSQNSQITVTFYWDTKKRQLQKPLMRHFVNYPFQWHTAIRFLGQNTPATSARQSSTLSEQSYRSSTGSGQFMMAIRRRARGRYSMTKDVWWWRRSWYAVEEDKWNYIDWKDVIFRL